MPAIFLIMNSVSKIPPEIAPQQTSAGIGRLRQNVDQDQGFAQAFSGSQSQPDSQPEITEAKPTLQQTVSVKHGPDVTPLPTVDASTRTSPNKSSRADDDTTVEVPLALQGPASAEKTNDEATEEALTLTPASNDRDAAHEQIADRDPALMTAELETPHSQSDGGASTNSVDAQSGSNTKNTDLSVAEPRLSTAAPAADQPQQFSNPVQNTETEDTQVQTVEPEPTRQIPQSDSEASTGSIDIQSNVDKNNSGLPGPETSQLTAALAPDQQPQEQNAVQNTSDSGAINIVSPEIQAAASDDAMNPSLGNAPAPLVAANGTAAPAENGPAVTGPQTITDVKQAAASPLIAAHSETAEIPDLPDQASPKQANDNVDTDILKTDNAPKGQAIDTAKIPLPTTSAPQTFDLPASATQTPAQLTQGPLKTAQMVAALPQTSTSAHVLQSVTQNILQAQFTQSGLSIRLDPPEMGNVTIQFQFGSDGDVTAVIKSDVPETSSILRERADILQQSLKDSGFSSVSLSFEQNNNSNGAQRQYQPLPEEGRTAFFNTGDFLEEKTAAQPSLQKQISAGRQIDIKL